MTSEIRKIKKAYAAKKAASDYTVRQLAADAGVHWTTVYDIFNKDQPTTFDTLAKLARALGLNFNIGAGKRRVA